MPLHLGQDIPLLDMAPKDPGSADQGGMSDEAQTDQQQSARHFDLQWHYFYIPRLFF
jgi:hypothetical protein